MARLFGYIKADLFGRVVSHFTTAFINLMVCLLAAAQCA